jgi:hypothetical protein
VNFNGLSKHLLSYAKQLLPEILPGGKINGHEYETSNLYGGNGDSLRVNIRTGVWCDFAEENVNGGDLISLYAAVYGITQAEAYAELAEKYGFNEKTSKFRHYKLGEPANVWKYNDSLFVARYNTRTGKQYRPIQIINKKIVWQSPDVRPLYNENKIINNPRRPILITEGEKACDAAQKIVNDKFLCVTWMGGTNATHKTDWSPIRDRSVVICPDADAPGARAADNIAKILRSQNNKVKIIEIDDKPSGWDLADEPGWSWDDFYAWAKPRARIVSDIEQNVTVNAVQVNVQAEDTPEVSGSAVVLWDNLGLALTSSGNPVANIDNAMRVLSGVPTLNNSIWYDEFFHQVFIDGRPLSDVEEFEIAVYMQSKIGLSRMTDTIVNKAIKAHARRNVRNEPREWLNSLVWDKTSRIDTFFAECVGCEDSEYTRAVSRNFMISMVARIFNPGCQCHSMVIFEGAQGKRKSTFLRSIAGEKYYTEAIENIYSNNFYQCLSGKIILEFAELSTWKKADIFKLKQMLSNSKDTYRAPYDRHQADHKRSSIFAGTTNEYEYLEDHTGARRFWPVKTGDIEINKTRDMREQLFAEAVHVYKSEDVEYDDQRVVSRWWEVPESALDEQEQRRVRDPWEEDIQRYVKTNIEFTMDDIMESCLKIEKSKKTRYDTIRIGKILAMLGYVKKRKTTGDRGYFYELENQEEIDENW